MNVCECVYNMSSSRGEQCKINDLTVLVFASKGAYYLLTSPADIVIHATCVSVLFR